MNKTPGKIILLESSDIGARYSAEAIKALGYEPLFLCNLADYQADPLAQIQAYPNLQCHTTSASAVIETLQKLALPDLVAVTSFVDSRLSVAVQVAQQMGLKGLDPQVANLKNKGTTYNFTPEFSPPSLLFNPAQITTSQLTQLKELLDGSGKIIIKPSAGAGAIGIFTITSEDEIANISDIISQKNVPAHFTNELWLAQAFLKGDLVSLEGYVLNGKTKTLGFTSRGKVHDTESSASFPVDASLQPWQKAHALKTVEALVERSGYMNGYFHIEFLLNEKSAVLIDANIGRPGGGPVGELLALSYGVDPIAIYQHALEVSLFGTENKNPYLHAEVASKVQAAHSVLYGLETGGELIRVSFPPDARVYHTQLLDGGAHATPMGTDDWSWIGIVTGLEADTNAAVRRLQIHTPQGVFPACY